MSQHARIYELLDRLSAVLETEERKEAARHGLLPMHLRVLHYFSRCNRYSDTPSALTEFLGATKGTVSQTIKVLEGKQLLEGNPDEHDRRRVHYRLTHEGKRVLHECTPPPSLARAELPPETSRTLTALLQAIQQARGNMAFGECRQCRHFIRHGPNRFQCGLTREPLTKHDSTLICREHEPAEAK